MHSPVILVEIDQIGGGGYARGEGVKPCGRRYPEALIVAKPAPSDQRLEARRQSIGSDNSQAEKAFTSLVVDAESTVSSFFTTTCVFFNFNASYGYANR